jgi:hypothetical protein
MSLPSSPTPPAHSEQDPTSPAEDPPHVISRTVAIIKTHALDHRLDIEPRIYEAGFEVRFIYHFLLNLTRFLDCKGAPDGIRHGDRP